MSSRLQLDVRNLSLGRRHLVNAYEVKAAIGVIAGNTVWSMTERLACTTKMSAKWVGYVPQSGVVYTSVASIYHDNLVISWPSC